MRIAGLAVLAILIPVFAYAAALVNINTADAATLDGLPYISSSLATAIIDYRTAHGPFARIEDIMNVSGIKSGIFSHIQPLITVGDVGTPSSGPGQVASSTPSDTSSALASTTEGTPVPSPGGGYTQYAPIPALRIVTNESRTVSSGADAAFTATVYDEKATKRNDAVVTWSFGDGMRKTGASVFHEYYDPGEYLAVVHATTADGGDALAEVVVTVKEAGIKIASVSSRGITLANNDSRPLDLSLWRLSMGGQEFKIPEDTQILAGHTILFPSQVIELPLADSAYLLYPSGEVASAYPAVQLVPRTASYEQVQAVEPAMSTSVSGAAHEKTAVSAPVATTELAAAGATLPQVPTASGIFRSPWTLGFLGVVALAGSAFIFL